MQLVLANLLLAHAPLAVLIGNRIHWDRLPQNVARPAVVMHLVSDVPNYHLLGPSGLIDSRVQFDCQAGSAEAAREVADALDARLGGYRGTYDGFKFGGAFRLSGRSRSDGDGPTAIFTRSMDFRIWSGLA
jgi:hypothetical protein